MECVYEKLQHLSEATPFKLKVSGRNKAMCRYGLITKRASTFRRKPTHGLDLSVQMIEFSQVANHFTSGLVKLNKQRCNARTLFSTIVSVTGHPRHMCDNSVVILARDLVT